MDTISTLTSIYIHIALNLIRYTLTTIYYPSCQQISVCYNYECKIIYKEFIYSNQIGSFLTILDTISTLTSIYIHIALNLIRYTLTTIYYPSCQQISVCYNLRVQSYSQRIYIQQSNWVIFDHFGTIFRLSSIYIHIAPSSILYTLTTIYYPSCQQISVCYNLRVQSYSQRIYIQQSNWVILTILDTIFRLSSIYIHIAPNSILYTLTTIYYPSCQQISVCYNIRVQNYLQRIYL